MIYICADDPNKDPNVSGDPYKTLFVARLVSKLPLLLNNFELLYFVPLGN